MTAIARLGGYSHHTSDKPLRTTGFWRSFVQLAGLVKEFQAKTLAHHYLGRKLKA